MPTPRARSLILPLALGLLTTLALCWIAPGALYNLLPDRWERWDGPVHNAPYSVLWCTTPFRTYVHCESSTSPWGAGAPLGDPPRWFVPPTFTDTIIREDTDAAGFPFRAVICRTGLSLPPPRGRYSTQYIHGGFQLSETSTRWDIIPFQPIWSGLLADLIIWSAACWVILSAIAHLRARRAAKRIGLCPKCRYDRTGLAPDAKCPECGTQRS